MSVLDSSTEGWRKIMELREQLAEAQQARERDCKKAREIAVNAIGYPCDDDDVKDIENATPLQAMAYLDEELKKRLKELHDTDQLLQIAKAERDTLLGLLREALSLIETAHHWHNLEYARSVRKLKKPR